MLKILLRSTAIALLITILSYVFTEVTTMIDEDFITYCNEGVEDDPECQEILEREQEELSDLVILVDFFYFLSEFFIAFFAAFSFGLWQYFYPLKK